jgi:hypothetical protein
MLRWTPPFVTTRRRTVLATAHSCITTTRITNDQAEDLIPRSILAYAGCWQPDGHRCRQPAADRELAAPMIGVAARESGIQ